MKHDSFQGRAFKHFYAFERIKGLDQDGNIAGLAFSQGRLWRDQRKFVLQNLNDLGMGRKATLEDVIGQVAQDTCDLLERDLDQGQLSSFSRRFLPSINNVVWRLLTGKFTSLEDEECKRLTNHISEFFHVCI